MVKKLPKVIKTVVNKYKFLQIRRIVFESSHGAHMEDSSSSLDLYSQEISVKYLVSGDIFDSSSSRSHSKQVYVKGFNLF